MFCFLDFVMEILYLLIMQLTTLVTFNTSSPLMLYMMNFNVRFDWWVKLLIEKTVQNVKNGSFYCKVLFYNYKYLKQDTWYLLRWSFRNKYSPTLIKSKSYQFMKWFLFNLILYALMHFINAFITNSYSKSI